MGRAADPIGMVVADMGGAGSVKGLDVDEGMGTRTVKTTEDHVGAVGKATPSKTGKRFPSGGAHHHADNAWRTSAVARRQDHFITACRIQDARPD